MSILSINKWEEHEHTISAYCMVHTEGNYSKNLSMELDVFPSGIKNFNLIKTSQLEITSKPVQIMDSTYECFL